MNHRQQDEEAIFEFARNVESKKLREEYLVQACGQNPSLRGRVDALLEVHDQQTDFLEQPPSDINATDDPAVTERPGTMIGKYKLMEQIGEGGMGIVYVAEQDKPIRRRVALKVIKPGMDSKEVIARFGAERQALALMDHPNIAKVHDAGATESGRPYFVMELVRGVPITEYCDLQRFNSHQRLQLFLNVCNAVQHAHQKGVIHRDLKPSNVLVTEHDGTPVVKVIDFGVAKATNQQLTERTIYTRFQQMVGTPLYMSPEQAELSGLDVDTRSDIYSLGVLLYELLTGTTPFDRDRFKEAAYDEIRRIIRDEEPSKPSTKVRSLGRTAEAVSGHRNTDPNRLSKALQGDLDWIVMKSLEKDRNRRYDTAKGFADDIERYVNDQPVEARPPSAIYQFQKMVRRNKVLFAVTVAIVSALAVGFGAAALGWGHAISKQRLAENNQRRAEIAEHQAQNQRDTAKRAEQVAERERRAADAARQDAAAKAGQYAHSLTVTSISSADTAIREGDFWLARTQLDASPEHHRGWTWRFLDRIQRAKIPLTIGAVQRPWFSADGSRITAINASTDEHLVSTWDVASGRILSSLKCDSPVSFVAVSDDGARVAAGDFSGNLSLWDAKSGAQLWSIPVHQDRFNGIAFSPDGQFIASAGWQDDPRVVLIDVAKPKIVFTKGPFNARPYGVEFHPDGRWVATSTHYGVPGKTVFINIETQETVELMSKGENFLPVFDSTGKLLATAHAIGERHSMDEVRPIKDWNNVPVEVHSIKIWNWNNGVPVEAKSWSAHEFQVRSLAFSADGNRLISGSYDKSTKVWELDSGKQIAVLNEGTSVSYQVASSPTREVAAVFSPDKIRLWQYRRNPLKKKIADSRVRVSFSPDGKRILASMPIPGQAFRSSSQEQPAGSTVVLDASSGNELFRLPAGLYAASWTPDGQQIFARSITAGVIFNAETGNRLTERPDENEYKVSQFDRLGRRWALLSDGRITTCDFASGSQHVYVSETMKSQRSLTAAAFTRDASHLGMGVSNGTVAVWDTKSESVVSRLRVRGQVPSRIAFATDGDHAFVGYGTGLIAAFDIDTGARIQRFDGPRGYVFGLAVSPDAKQIVSAIDRDLVVVWDVVSGRRLVTLAEGEPVVSLDWSPDGTRIVAGNEDGTIRIWALTPSP